MPFGSSPCKFLALNTASPDRCVLGRVSSVRGTTVGGGEERSRNGTDGIATHASSSSASGHRLEQPPTLPGMRSWAPSLASLQGPASVLVSVGKAEGARVGGPVRPRWRRGRCARTRPGQTGEADAARSAAAHGARAPARRCSCSPAPRHRFPESIHQFNKSLGMRSSVISCTRI